MTKGNDPVAVRLRRRLLSVALLLGGLLVWHAVTLPPAFDPTGLSEDELLVMELNGDIVRDQDGAFVVNRDKISGFPGPAALLAKFRAELANPFHKNGTNDHGIFHLVSYTVARFAIGFVAASIIAILLGVLIGLSSSLYAAINPFLQVMKPISPLAWMPLLLYTVQEPTLTAVLVVFLAALWPTIANTAFGVSNIKQDYLRLASALQLPWHRRLLKVVLPAAAPAMVAGLRISFGSALVAVVPAEMLLGELGVGYLTWIEWNNLDIAGVLFAIFVIGMVGVTLDAAFSRLARTVTYAD